MLTLTVPTTNSDKQGNGQYQGSRKRKVQKKQKSGKEFLYLKNNDRRMRFNNSQDPIYYAFEVLENRTVPQLMGDFVKDSFFEISTFISKVVA